MVVPWECTQDRLTLGWDVSPKRGISPQLLIQHNILLYLLSLSAARNHQVPSSARILAELWGLCPAPSSCWSCLDCGVRVECLIQGVPTAFPRGISPFSPQSLSHKVFKGELRVGGTEHGLMAEHKVSSWLLFPGDKTMWLGFPGFECHCIFLLPGVFPLQRAWPRRG